MNIIQQIRKHTGETQAQFAQSIGVEQPTVSNYETGRRQPEITISLAIKAHAKTNGFPVSLEDIYGNQD